MTPSPSFHRSSGLAAVCGLALVAGIACNGVVAVDPIGAPAGSGNGSAPGTDTLSGSQTPEGPSKQVIPPQPVGPYTGPVGTTDVSILYPLPASGEVVDFVRPTELGNHGVLLPETLVSTVLGPQGRLDRVKPEPPSGYAELALVSLRLDPCGARGVSQGACKSEVRAVFQALYQKAAGLEEDPSSGTAATDGGIHVMYDIDDAELVTMLKEILTLKKANGDLALQELAPHPIMKAQGLGGAFAKGLRSIILSHAGADRIGRVTVFDHNIDPDEDGWTFKIFERQGAGLVQAQIPGLVVDQPSTVQTIAGSPIHAPLSEASAEDLLGGAADAVEALVSRYRPAPGSPGAAALQSAFETALKVQNPDVHTAETTSCGNCHLAEGARRIGESIYSLDPAKAFTHPRSLAYVHEQPTLTNLHAFGYLHRKVSIMQRTANESVLVAGAMELKVK